MTANQRVDLLIFERLWLETWQALSELFQLTFTYYDCIEWTVLLGLSAPRPPKLVFSPSARCSVLERVCTSVYSWTTKHFIILSKDHKKILCAGILCESLCVNRLLRSAHLIYNGADRFSEQGSPRTILLEILSSKQSSCSFSRDNNKWTMYDFKHAKTKKWRIVKTQTGLRRWADDETNDMHYWATSG